MRSTKPLSKEQADATLQQIFEACDVEHEAPPVEELESRGRTQLRNLSLTKKLIIAALVILFFFPFTLIPPHFRISETMGADYLTLELQVNSFWPVRSVTATLDGNPLPIAENGDNSKYTIVVPENGVVTLKATTIFYASTDLSEEYTAVPVKLPSVTEHKLENNILSITLEEGTNPIAFEEIRMMDENGEYPPDSIDKETATVYFTLPYNDITISIPDEKGNVFQVLIASEPD